MILAAAERMDTWVFKVSVAVPLLCLAGLLLLHLLARLSRSAKKPRVYRHSPEPERRAPSGERGAKEAEDLRSSIFDPHSSPAADRSRRARELLALIRDDFSTSRFRSCLDRCQALVAAFPDLPEGAEARQVAAEIRDDPQRLQRACATLENSLAETYLDLAECWLRRGEPQQAAAAWQKVIESCPQTPQAEVARERLRQLGAGEPGEPGEPGERHS
jgi:hypothetical protein